MSTVDFDCGSGITAYKLVDFDVTSGMSIFGSSIDFDLQSGLAVTDRSIDFDFTSQIQVAGPPTLLDFDLSSETSVETFLGTGIHRGRGRRPRRS